MKLRTRSRALAVALLITLALSACTDAGKQLAIAAKTNLEVQKFAIASEKAGRMTVAETKIVVDATDRIAKVGLSAVTMVERFKASDPGSKTAALDAIGIVVDELAKLQLETVGIKNASSRHQIEALLAAVQTSLNSARVAIAATQ